MLALADIAWLSRGVILLALVLVASYVAATVVMALAADRIGHAPKPIATDATQPATSFTWLVPAVLVTLVFSTPLGIRALIHASRVRPLCECGDLAGAREAAQHAKRWFLWGAGLGCASVLACCVLPSVIAVAIG